MTLASPGQVPAEALQILVLSDLHAHTSAPDAGGAASLAFNGTAHHVQRMFDSIPMVIERAGMSVDLVLCPGDLADRCNETALPLVWSRLVELADRLGATLVATAGNHDMLRSGSDPKGPLMSLEPEFPARDSNLHASYFAYGIARVDTPKATIFALNSASLTGLKAKQGEADEDQHGRVLPDQIRRLKVALQAAPPSGHRLLLVHHHPVQLPLIDLQERSQIRDAEQLLQALEEDGPWLIVHGHKHRPWLQYAPGGGGSAVLFSAGSFAAPLDGVLSQSTRNQFYVLDVPARPKTAALDLGAAGRFRAWSHVPVGDDAWIPSGSNDGLPAHGGFGWRPDPRSVAARLHDALTSSASAELDAAALELLEPRLAYLIPADWIATERALRVLDADVRVERDPEGRLQRLALLRPLGADV